MPLFCTLKSLKISTLMRFLKPKLRTLTLCQTFISYSFIVLKENRLSCYARSLWYLLTGEDIRMSIKRETANDELSGEQKIKKFAAYPNPVIGLLTIENPIQDEKVIISILDLNGRQIIELSSAESEIKLDTRSLSSGVYFLNVKTTKGILVGQSKVVKL